MGQATLSMRVDDTLKKKFDMICDDFGFTSTAAITVFMKEAWEAFLEMKTQAAASGVQDLTLDEINAEIQKARNER